MPDERIRLRTREVDTCVFDFSQQQLLLRPSGIDVNEGTIWHGLQTSYLLR
jgi:hypothetical protein